MAKVRVNLGPAAEGSSVKLYEVFNTAHRSLLVLAPDKATAIRIAHTANHIHWIWDRMDKSYPHVAEVRDPSSCSKLAHRLGSVQTAIAQRLQGTIHLDHDDVYVGCEPLTADE